MFIYEHLEKRIQQRHFLDVLVHLGNRAAVNKIQGCENVRRTLRKYVSRMNLPPIGKGLNQYEDL